MPSPCGILQGSVIFEKKKFFSKITDFGANYYLQDSAIKKFIQNRKDL